MRVDPAFSDQLSVPSIQDTLREISRPSHFGGYKFPSNPRHKDEARVPVYSGSFQTAAWRFWYDATSGAWIFDGGAPLTHQVLTDEGTTSASYVDLTTYGPWVTLPWAGIYNASWGAECYMTGGAGSWVNFTGLHINNVEAFRMDTGLNQTNFPVPSAQGGSLFFNPNSAGEARLKYAVSPGAGNTARFRKRWIEVLPLHVIA